MSDREHPRDVESDELIEAGDLRLVEALYGESPTDDVDSDLLASYSDLRSMFSDLPEEEPPGAITAKLMSAAAEAVKSSKPEKRGLWARLVAFLEPIGAHPALAAAASLVLVVAIGGVLVMTGRSDIAEPQTSPTSPPPASLETEAPSQTAEPDPIDVPAPPPADIAPGESTVEPEGKPALEKSGGERRTTPRKRRGPETSSRTSVDKNRGKGKTGLDFSGGALDSDDLGDSNDKKSGGGSRNERTNAPTMQPQKPSKSAAEVESLTSRGRRAAAKGDCAAVLSIGSRVRALDADHFSAVYRRDTRIDACYQAQQKSVPNTAQ